MATDYSALIQKWPTAPAGSVESRLAWINAEVINGPVPRAIIHSYLIYNAVDPAEFDALTDTPNSVPPVSNKQVVRDIWYTGQTDISSGSIARRRLNSLFAVGTNTRTALTALYATYDTPPKILWYSAPINTGNLAAGGGGLPAPVNQNDLTAAGLS